MLLLTLPSLLASSALFFPFSSSLVPLPLSPPSPPSPSNTTFSLAKLSYSPCCALNSSSIKNDRSMFSIVVIVCSAAQHSQYTSSNTSGWKKADRQRSSVVVDADIILIIPPPPPPPPPPLTAGTFKGSISESYVLRRVVRLALQTPHRIFDATMHWKGLVS